MCPAENIAAQESGSAEIFHWRARRFSDPNGKIASGQTSLASTFAMTIGGTNATVQYAGLAPGLVGVYQFNVVVPANLPTGDLPVQFTLNGVLNPLQNLFLAVRTTPVSSTFTLTSSVGASGGVLPADYTCDGTGSTLPLSWSNAPAGTKEFAVMMTTLPGDGTTKWNWVLYNLRPTLTSIAKDAFLVGTVGVGSDGLGSAVFNHGVANVSQGCRRIGTHRVALLTTRKGIFMAQ